jgi:isopentenyl-diphosphate delta-isomerase
MLVVCCCSSAPKASDFGHFTGRTVAAAIRGEVEFVYKFRYQARFGELGSEHELCHVLLGRLEDEPRANATEIAALRRVTAAELDREFRDRSEAFTPWFRMEWQRLKDEFATTLARYTNPV